ncbi:hypothetical protein J6590_097861 [Homalodisca vitripennis]|nr:hypothetical protein J6590_097861 [Homalodisca vitripennis]
MEQREIFDIHNITVFKERFYRVGSEFRGNCNIHNIAVSEERFYRVGSEFRGTYNIASKLLHGTFPLLSFTKGRERDNFPVWVLGRPRQDL